MRQAGFGCAPHTTPTLRLPLGHRKMLGVGPRTTRWANSPTAMFVVLDYGGEPTASGVQRGVVTTSATGMCAAVVSIDTTHTRPGSAHPTRRQQQSYHQQSPPRKTSDPLAGTSIIARPARHQSGQTPLRWCARNVRCTSTSKWRAADSQGQQPLRLLRVHPLGPVRNVCASPHHRTTHGLLEER